MKKILCKTLIVFSTLVYSFDKASAEQPKLWIQGETGLFATEHVTNGKEKAPMRAYGTYDVTHLVKDNAQALEWANKANDYRCYANWTMWAGFLPVMGLAIYFATDENPAGYWASLGAGLGFALTTGYFGRNSRTYSLKAINIYNGVPNDQAQKKEALTYDFAFFPVKQGGAMNLALQF